MAAFFAGNIYYVLYENLLKRLHQLVMEGSGGTKEANDIRDAMALPEQELTDEELGRLDGLSADLYMLHDDEVFEPLEPGYTVRDVIRELKEAWDGLDWERVLALLRKAMPISQEHRAYLRARAYDELGHLDTARHFMEYASKQNLEDANYRFFVLHYLLGSHRYPEALQQANQYIAHEDTPPELVILSAATLYQSTQILPEYYITPVIRDVIDALLRALAEKNLIQATPAAVVALGYVVLGSCLERFGDIEKAYRAYHIAAQIDPGLAATTGLTPRLEQPETQPLHIISTPISVPEVAKEVKPSYTSPGDAKMADIWTALAAA